MNYNYQVDNGLTCSTYEFFKKYVKNKGMLKIIKFKSLMWGKTTF